MKLGDYNDLKILRFTSVGAYLGDEEGNDVLLPNKYLTDEMDIDDVVCVFLYRDSEDRLVATTEDPKIILGQFAYLKVNSVNFYGAFMDWGLEKELMIPFREQKKKLEEDHSYLVHLMMDTSTDRLVGTTKVDKYLKPCTNELSTGDKVQLLICENTDLGTKVIVENKFKGLIFKNDVVRNIHRGQKTTGYVSNVRNDGKLDIRLEKEGYDKVSGSSEKLLRMLQEHKELQLTDKSDPDDIREIAGMSKKTFKQAVGNLYKQRLIRLESDRIILVEDQKAK